LGRVFTKREGNPHASDTIFEVHSVSHRFLVVATPNGCVDSEWFDTTTIAMIQVVSFSLSSFVEYRKEPPVIVVSVEGHFIRCDRLIARRL